MARLLLVVLLGLVGLGPHPAGAQDAAPADLPLSEALAAFAGAHHVDLIYDPALVEGLRAPFAPRLEAPGTALGRMLDGTGLGFYRLPSGTYVLVRARRPTGTLGGVVLDQSTGEPLPGAHILLADLSAGAATDETGLFRFADVQPGHYRVMASHLGYAVEVDTVQVLPAGRTEALITLRPEPVQIAPVVVEDPFEQAALDAAARLARPGQARPGGTATSDAVRSLNHLMGVQVGDALGDVHVQGGEAGEHQFQLDGVPIFEPVHVRGLLGAFSPFALERVTVHKAGFGVAHGSHLAGLVAAEHQLGSPDGRRLDVQYDPLSLNARGHARLEGGFGTLQTMAALRASLWHVYPRGLDLPLRATLRDWNTPDPFLLYASFYGLLEAAPEGESGLDDVLTADTLVYSPVSDPDLGFQDTHAAVAWSPSAAHRLDGSFYQSYNRLNGNRLSLPQGTPFLRFGRDFAEADQTLDGPGYTPAGRDDYEWTNTAAQLRYRRLLGPRTFATAQLRASAYRLSHIYNTLEQGAIQVVFLPDGQAVPLRMVEDVRPTDDGNRIREHALDVRLDHAFGPDHYLQGGVLFLRSAHRFSLEDVLFRPILNRSAAARAALWGETRWALAPRTHLTTGVRLTALADHRRLYPEPRVALRHEREGGPLGPWSAFAAAGVYRQYTGQYDMSSLSPSALLPYIRFWMPVDATVAPPRAYHATGALRLTPAAGWTFQAESFYKRQPHLLTLDYSALWSLLQDSTRSGEVAQSRLLSSGEGYGYGLAFKVERRAGLARWSARYEHGSARRSRSLVPGGGGAPPAYAQYADLARGFAAPAGGYEPVPWNVPHRLDLRLDWTPAPRLAAYARWQSAWGRTWAFRRAYYHYLSNNPAAPPVYGEYDLRTPEQHRLAPLHQLDVGTAYTHEVGPVALQLRLDVLNALDRRNEAEWTLRADPQQGGTIRYHLVRRYLLPRTPSVSLRARW